MNFHYNNYYYIPCGYYYYQPCYIPQEISRSITSSGNSINSYNQDFRPNPRPIIFTRDRYTIKLAIYVTPGANVSNDRIIKDLSNASKMWNMTIISPPHYGYEIKNISGSEVTFTDRDFNTGESKPKKLSNLFTNYKGADPTVITVYYIGSNNTGGNSKARAYYTSSGSSKQISASIVIGNGESNYLLAHELGHCLFARYEGGKLDSIDPLSNSSHNTVSGNVMNASVSNKTKTPAEPAQLSKAYQSHFVRFIKVSRPNFPPMPVFITAPPLYPDSFYAGSEKIEILGSDPSNYL